MKGVFKCKNPKKYDGDAKGIIYRSSYELKAFIELDSDPSVIAWASEELAIPYKSPKDGLVHRYFPDLIVKRKTKTGSQITIYEIKPAVQCIPPKPGRNKKRFLTEAMTYEINMAKWDAAEKYAASKGWDFKILTEKELNIPAYKKKPTKRA